jgi:hypothetical protein
MTAHFETKPATVATCLRCAAVILSGLVEGIRARVDMTPLSTSGELAALLANRWTYTLTRVGLVYRDASRIRDPKLRVLILADHRCGHLWPAQHRAPPMALPPPAQPTDQPPF